LPRELLDSQKIFAGIVFDVERDRLREESGLEVIRDVVRHPGGAGGLPLFADGRVALVRQYRHPARRELLEIPAGRIEAGETPAECAAREIEAEIGARAGRLEKLAEFYSTPGFCEEKLYVYLATELTPARQNLDHDEVVEIVSLPLIEAVRLAAQGEVADSKTIIALLLAAQREGVRCERTGHAQAEGLRVT
jgi:ADP-ribose pyrophosphatase